MINYDEDTNEINVNVGDTLIVVNREPIYDGHYFEVGDMWTVCKKDEDSLYIKREGVKFNKDNLLENAYDFGWFSNIYIAKAFDKATK